MAQPGPCCKRIAGESDKASKARNQRPGGMSNGGVVVAEASDTREPDKASEPRNQEPGTINVTSDQGPGGAALSRAKIKEGSVAQTAGVLGNSAAAA